MRIQVDAVILVFLPIVLHAAARRVIEPIPLDDAFEGLAHSYCGGLTPGRIQYGRAALTGVADARIDVREAFTVVRAGSRRW